jgi:hypothetical protein
VETACLEWIAVGRSGDETARITPAERDALVAKLERIRAGRWLATAFLAVGPKGSIGLDRVHRHLLVEAIGQWLEDAEAGTTAAVPEGVRKLRETLVLDSVR